MSIERNQPCPCGSGKKYKKCCINKIIPTDSTNLMQHKIRKTEGELVNYMQEWATTSFDEDPLVDAFDEFFDYAEYPISEEQIEMLWENTLWPWAFFNWQSYFGKSNTLKTLAESLISQTEFKATAFQKQFVETACSQPFCFWLVEDVQEGKGLYLKNIMLGNSVYVHEKKAAIAELKGEIFFARIITLNKTSVIFGNLPWIIPNNYTIDIYNFGEKLLNIVKGTNSSINTKILKKHEAILFTFFWNLLEDSQKPPIITNQDNHIIELNDTFYKHNKPIEEIAELLLPLTFYADIETLLKEEGVYKKQKLIKLSFPTIDKRKNIIKSEITLTPKKLIISCNSAKRAGGLKTSITRRLGSKVQYEKQIFMPPETDNQASIFEDKETIKDFSQTPEAQQAIKLYADEHWKNWINDSLPALNNQTPIQASKTAKGRDLLEALLLKFENMTKSEPQPFLPNVEALRKRLSME